MHTSKSVLMRLVFMVLCGSVVAMLAGCGLIYPSDRLRQRITVEVETPQGVRTGSSVVETEVQEGKSWGDASGIQFTLKGEAVAVSLPGGRTLFAVLHGSGDTFRDDPASYQVRLLSDALRAGAQASVRVPVQGLNLMQARAAAKRAKVNLTLPRNLYPTLVTFADPTDPRSVEQVVPTDLAATFGPGVRLKRITLAVTNDAVTTGISARLPSYDSVSDEWFRNLVYGDPRAFYLFDFRQGTK